MIVADGVDDDMGPKAGAVLADAPAFFFKSALSLDGFQRLLRLAGFPIFIRIELREVRPMISSWQIAFDPLRAKVPVGHDAFWVEHVDGVVGNTLHQQPELLLALLERFLGGFAFGQVARNLGKADEFAGRLRIGSMTT